MIILWDEPKRRINLERRGLDFADLTLEFFLAAKVETARDGRYKAIGRHGDTVLAVIFRPLGVEALSIISMRRASRKERSIL